MHTLPDDILQHIFNHVGEDFDAVFTAVSSSQVCQGWRTAALQNRMMWVRSIDWLYSPVIWIEESRDTGARSPVRWPLLYGLFKCVAGDGELRVRLAMFR